MSVSNRVRPVAAEPAETRIIFIQKTYFNLGAAVLAFIILESYLLSTNFASYFIRFAFGGRYNWLIVLGAFAFVGWIADTWARSEGSPGFQYIGLGLYVLAEAVLFLPLIYLAATYASPRVVPSAALVTLIIFGGLSVFVLVSRVDFTFLRMALSLATLLALALIATSLLFGTDLGTWFSVVMVGLAAGYIVYQTSAILHSYRKDQPVAAALALFASLALLFWYVLRIFISLDDD